jgi:hypothetical protein
MSIDGNEVRLNRSRRLLIISAALVLLPAQTFGAEVNIGYGTPPEKGPYMLGVASFPNPIESDQAVLSRKSKIESAEKIPSQNDLKRNAGKVTAQ